MKTTYIEVQSDLQQRHHRANCALKSTLRGVARGTYRLGKQPYLPTPAQRGEITRAVEELRGILEAARRADDLVEVYERETLELFERAEEVLAAP